LSKTHAEAHFERLASSWKQARQNAHKLLVKTKKRAAIFGGRPLLETDMFIPRRSGHPSHTMIHGPWRTFEFGHELQYLSHAIKYYTKFLHSSSALMRSSSESITPPSAAATAHHLGELTRFNLRHKVTAERNEHS
jgi:hypothetical protein